MNNKIKRFKLLIQDAKKIMITTHTHPDADGIGSEVALSIALNKLNKNVMCINEAPLFKRYQYLDPFSSIQDYEKMKNEMEGIDLLIIVDTNSLGRIGENIQKIASKISNIIFVDHHPCTKELEELHCIDSSKAATGELISEIIKSLDVKIDKDIALALYTSIIIDTSSFRYPNVRASTHRVIADLIDCGISPPAAFNQINGIKKVSYIKLLGAVLTSIQTDDLEEISWISLNENLLKKYHSVEEDTHSFINHLLILDKIKIACMFRQSGNRVKISFRSADKNIDVGTIAQFFGGGGHYYSAATILDGELQEVIKKVIPQIQNILNKK